MLRRLVLLACLLTLAGGCAQFTKFLTSATACVASGSLDGWLGSRLNEKDWPSVGAGANTEGILGRLLNCGLEGLADAVASADGGTDPRAVRRARAERCRSGPCTSARERAAAILERAVIPLTALHACRASDPRAVVWLRESLPRNPELAEDILRKPFGAELEMSLRDVANSGPAGDRAVAIARTALRRHDTRRCQAQ